MTRLTIQKNTLASSAAPPPRAVDSLAAASRALDHGRTGVGREVGRAIPPGHRSERPLSDRRAAVFATLAPVVPLGLTMMSLEDLVKKLAGVLF